MFVDPFVVTKQCEKHVCAPGSECNMLGIHVPYHQKYSVRNPDTSTHSYHMVTQNDIFFGDTPAVFNRTTRIDAVWPVRVCAKMVGKA